MDGWRILLAKVDGEVRLLTRGGENRAHQMPGLVEQLKALPDRCILDGELVADEDDRLGDVFSVARAIAAGKCHLLSVMAFDLLVCEGEDLRRMPLIDRKALLNELVERANLPCLSYVPGFVDGDVLFETMDKLGLEGVVSKKLAPSTARAALANWGEDQDPDMA